ncbi:hypothetical protein GGI15_000831 [Coemansia interrupta]|uniref:SAP domain-containing protein n=1 Tax=Coemansia interrupta TaxID=1126814 RepID=A0A9W8LPG0_9FUNG|nr:hypothetical protein GGI15_000831 [Coemansia interrupta]
MVTTVADIDIDQLAGLKRKQIQSLCKKHGIRANGKTEELIEHLTAYARDGSRPNEPAADQQEDGEDEQDKDLSEAPEEVPPAPESEQPVEAADSSLADEVNSEVVEKVAEEAADEAIEETAKEVAEEAVEKTAEEVINEATEEMAKKVVEESTEDAVEEAAVEAVDEAAENVVSEVAGNMAEEAVDEAAENAPKETIKEPAEDVSATSPSPIVEESTITEDKGSSIANIAQMTPKRSGDTKAAPKTLAFDRIHQNMFNSGDSIANHWSVKRAATPKAKRMDGDDAVPASNKRARIEPLFTSPGPKPQQPAMHKLSSALTSASNVPDSAEQDTSPLSATAAANTPEEEMPPLENSTAVSSSDKTDDATKSLIRKPSISKSNIEKRLSETTSLPSRIPPPRKSDQPATTNPAEDPKAESKPTNTSLATNLRVVESKIKAYISAKPPSPKVKAVKHKVVDPKQQSKTAPTTKPAAALPSDVKKKPKPSTADNDGIPSYMRPTRATESRAQAHKPASTKAPVKGREENGSHTGNGNKRFSPYSRPSNLPAKKATTDKSAMPKPAVPSAK